MNQVSKQVGQGENPILRKRGCAIHPNVATDGRKGYAGYTVTLDGKPVAFNKKRFKKLGDLVIHAIGIIESAYQIFDSVTIGGRQVVML